jgi:hypothetical protein
VSQKCYNAKNVFLAVIASFHWHNNVSGMFYLVKVSFLLIGQQGLGHQVLTSASHWLEDCTNLTPTPEKNYRLPLLEQYKQQANPLLLMHNIILHYDYRE